MKTVIRVGMSTCGLAAGAAATYQALLGHAKLTTTARYTHVATKTIRDTVSPCEMLARLQDQTVKRSLE